MTEAAARPEFITGGYNPGPAAGALAIPTPRRRAIRSAAAAGGSGRGERSCRSPLPGEAGEPD